MMGLKLTVPAVMAGLLASSGVHAAVWTWTNGAGDNVFTNALNWDNGFPSNETMVVSLSGKDKAVLSDGMVTPNMDGIRVAYNSGDAGEVEQTGGIMNITAMAGREHVVGHGGGTGIWTQTGGTNYMNNLTIGAGGGTGTVLLSNGVMEVANTYKGNSIIIATENAASVGTFELSGGVLKTAYGISLGKDNGGTPTFHINGGSGVVSNGVLNGATSGSWYQDATSRLKATIDSDDGFSLGQIMISSGSNDNPTVTFQYGAVIDVAFSGAGPGSVTQSWDIITWPSNTVVTDNGLSFDTNVVDLADWSFSITNHALRVTYGIGSDPVVVSNPPPSGPRTLYWTGAGGTNDSQAATNWVTDTSGTPAAWGIYEDDTIYIGHSSVNASDFVSEVDYNGGAYSANQAKLFIGRAREGILNFNSGSIVLPKPASGVSSYVGWNSAEGKGTINLNGGSLSLYATDLGTVSGAQGTINVIGGALVLPGRIASAAGNGARASIWIGTRGTGTVNVVSGSINTLLGVVLGDAGGTGTFCVEGTGASEIDIGGTRSDFDGYWVQNSNSTLKIVIDGTAEGVTPIGIREDGNENGERVGLADVVFEAGSLLDVSWAAGVTNYGSFDVMTFGGTYADEGLALAPGVDTNIWSFAFVDSDGDATNDTLRVTAYGETARGTPIPWLAENGLTEADDEADIDGDGLDTWEEYIAGTVPTNAASVLKVTALGTSGDEVVITWQSVEGKSYSIITNLSLAIPDPGIAVSGIPGEAGETSYTSSIPAAAGVFYEIGVDE